MVADKASGADSFLSAFYFFIRDNSQNDEEKYKMRKRLFPMLKKVKRKKKGELDKTKNLPWLDELSARQVELYLINEGIKYLDNIGIDNRSHYRTLWRHIGCDTPSSYAEPGFTALVYATETGATRSRISIYASIHKLFPRN